MACFRNAFLVRLHLLIAVYINIAVSTPASFYQNNPVPVEKGQPWNQASPAFTSNAWNASSDTVQPVIVMPTPRAHPTWPLVSKTALSIVNMLGLGGLGVDRCLMGQLGCGLFKFFTLGGFLIVAIVDYWVIVGNCLTWEPSINTDSFQADFQGGSDITFAFWCTLLFLALKCCQCCLNPQIWMLLGVVLAMMRPPNNAYDLVGGSDIEAGYSNAPPGQQRAPTSQNAAPRTPAATSAPAPIATAPKANSSTKVSPEPLPSVTSPQAKAGQLPHVSKAPPNVSTASSSSTASQQALNPVPKGLLRDFPNQVASKAEPQKRNADENQIASTQQSATNSSENSLSFYGMLGEKAEVAAIKSALGQLTVDQKTRLEDAIAKASGQKDVGSKTSSESMIKYSALIEGSSAGEIQSAINTLTKDARMKLETAVAKTYADAQVVSLKDYAALVAVTDLADIQSTIGKLAMETQERLRQGLAKVELEEQGIPRNIIKTVSDFSVLAAVANLADIQSAFSELSQDDRKRLERALAQAG